MTRTQPLPVSTPHEQGVDPAGVLAFLDAAERGGHELHSLAIARHGHVVAQGWWAPYAPDRVHLLYSLSKSFTATAVGLLVDEGRLDLDARVFDLLPTDDVPVHPRYQDLTVRHCLTMTTGHLTEAFDEAVQRATLAPATEGLDPVLRAILARPPERDPGTVFAYNQIATYLVAAVVRTVAGAPVLDYLRPRLFEPLGIEEVHSHRTAHGHELGFSGIHADTGAVLGLAQLYLSQGRARDRQVLPPEWVRQATVPSGRSTHHEDAQPDWCLGYGCSFWTSSHGYRGDGAYGQFALVLPEQDALVVTTAEDDDMQGLLDLVWEHLVPALDRAGDPSADDLLADRLARVAIPALASTGTGPPRQRWTVTGGELAGALTEVSLASTGQDHTLELHLGHGATHQVPVGDGRWTETAMTRDGWVLPVVASGGWTVDGGFEADVRVIETPHTIQVRAHRAGSASVGWRRVPMMGPDPFRSAVRREPTAR